MTVSNPHFSGIPTFCSKKPKGRELVQGHPQFLGTKFSDSAWDQFLQDTSIEEKTQKQRQLRQPGKLKPGPPRTQEEGSHLSLKGIISSGVPDRRKKRDASRESLSETKPPKRKPFPGP